MIAPLLEMRCVEKSIYSEVRNPIPSIKYDRDRFFLEGENYVSQTEVDTPDLDETSSKVSNSTAKNSTTEEQVQYKEKKKTVKSQLKTVGGELSILKITKQNMESSIRKLKDLKAKDVEKRLAEQAKDELERFKSESRLLCWLFFSLFFLTLLVTCTDSSHYLTLCFRFRQIYH